MQTTTENADMKRDMELVREILFCAEREEGLTKLSEKHGAAKVIGHVAILNDAGLVDAVLEKNYKGKICMARICRLTWGGHEFLDNARSDVIWNAVIKKVSATVESVSFVMLERLLKQFIHAELHKHGIMDSYGLP